MSTNTLIRGRPGRKRANRLSKGFLIEKGIKGTQLKKDLVLGGRININDLDSAMWLNPTVVLRRLTVTIGGFKIELLPGPAYTQSVDTSQVACFDDGFSFSGDIGLDVLPHDVNIPNAISENVAEMDVTEKSLTDDTTLGLGPYVNPNDVQTSNGTLLESLCTEETKQDNQNVPENKKPVSKRKESVKHPQSIGSDTAAIGEKADIKDKHQAVVKTLLKSKQGPMSNKNKDLTLCKTSHTMKEHKESQNKPSKLVQRGDLHKTKSLKDKQAVSPLKRSVENTQSEPSAKMQKVHGAGDDKLKPKSPTTPNPVTKKSPSSIVRSGDHLGPSKQRNPHHVSKVEPDHQVNSHPGSSLKPPQESGQEKFKLKKLEKILAKHKNRNSRSISVEEPELFIPDNAPAVKKEPAEEQPANSEAVWDGNNCCGLCKKHHNNM